MADNPLPPLRSNASVPEIVDWLNKLVRPRITKERALQWSQVNSSEGSIDDLQDGGTLSGAVSDNANAIADHIAETEAHGATGNIVGSDDRPTTTVGGTVLKHTAIADASETLVNPSPAYVEAEAQAVATQTRNNGQKINEIIAALEAVGILET